MAGIGPAPFAGMLLSDMGAEVIRIDRAAPQDLGITIPENLNLTNRGRRSLVLDLKSPEGIRAMEKLVPKADALIEGFRPGVMERLGLGPEHLLGLNPKLVFGRVTGWGQTGPLAQAAGHDINYVALSGMLHAIGTPERPVPPLNLVGDYGGGSLNLVIGVLAALLEAQRSGKGQVVDAAMVDGVALLGSLFYGLLQAGLWSDRRGANELDGGAPWYGTYRTRDGSWIAIGPVERRFYELMLEKLGLDDPALKDRAPSNWEYLRQAFEAAFATRDRDEWCRLLEGTDICFAPVLSLGEAPNHPHLAARATFVEFDGVLHPAPAPRFSRTESAIQGPPPAVGEHSRAILAGWGFSEAEIAETLGDAS